MRGAPPSRNSSGHARLQPRTADGKPVRSHRPSTPRALGAWHDPFLQGGAPGACLFVRVQENFNAPLDIRLTLQVAPRQTHMRPRAPCRMQPHATGRRSSCKHCDASRTARQPQASWPRASWTQASRAQTRRRRYPHIPQSRRHGDRQVTAGIPRRMHPGTGKSPHAPRRRPYCRRHLQTGLDATLSWRCPGRPWQPWPAMPRHPGL